MNTYLERKTSISSPLMPESVTAPISWQNLSGCSSSLAIVNAAMSYPGITVVICDSNQAALQLEHELHFFADSTNIPILSFPNWETLPYDVFPPLPEIISQRLETLALLPQLQQGIVVLSINTLLQRLAPREHILANSFSMEIGSHLAIDEMREKLQKVGYQNVSQVYQHGEFAVRGAILDLYPMGAQTPYRIELLDDEIDSIRLFDPETQRTLTQQDYIRLFPAREFPFTDDSIRLFRQNYRAILPNASTTTQLYQDVSKNLIPGGIEYYFPLFVQSTETFFDYLPTNSVMVQVGNIHQAAKLLEQETTSRYEQRRHDSQRPLLPPEKLFIDRNQLFDELNKFPCAHLSCDTPDSQNIEVTSFQTTPLPDITIQHSLKNPAEKLERFLHEHKGRTLFIAETSGHRESLIKQLRQFGSKPKVFDSWPQFLNTEEDTGIITAPINEGVILNDLHLAIITENKLLGNKAQQKRRQRSSSRELDNIVNSLAELSEGAPVVHIEHGVGRYIGLKTLDLGGINTEFLTLEYANSDKLYVPVSSLHLISRYTGANPDTAPLHKMGSDQWSKAKTKAMSRVRDVAAELLDIHAKRAAKPGRKFSIDEQDLEKFADQFPFEETPDQQNAIDNIIEDLTSNKTMDRVVCGDVGFGKTEVAMRAAHVVVHNGCQVAVMVPTTLLAQQHYQNFLDRFADWPVRVEVISRFNTKKQQDAILQDLENGQVDILIGTHKLLQKSIRYQDLGLVIIDEEHRFGVTHKEHFKKLRSELDLLTLTATPIPRTLNMAMSGLRDISIIATPPPNRHAIKTFVSEWIDSLVQEACLRETQRGGQVFFLHNDVKSMERMRENIQKLVPDARIEIAHGQMSERELERIMLDFYHQRFNILLCTTIIESGIDVPSANTIIINRADKLGLAQLHQLRGRVGRSHHRAYAYLLIPSKKGLTKDAAKRLQAIETTGDLGAGFMLSSHDLEIRGAGELLGDEQTGQIQEIGYSMYTELLEKAVKALREGKSVDMQAPMETGPEVDLQVSALIPDDYLPDIHARLVLYKRIANAVSEEDLDDLQIEMIDRFGLLPEQTKSLFTVQSIKNQASRLGISRVETGASGGRFIFSSEPHIDSEQLITLLQSQPATYKLDGPEKLKFTQQLSNEKEKVKFIQNLINRLTPKNINDQSDNRKGNHAPQK